MEECLVIWTLSGDVSGMLPLFADDDAEEPLEQLEVCAEEGEGADWLGGGGGVIGRAVIS